MLKLILARDTNMIKEHFKKLILFDHKEWCFLCKLDFKITWAMKQDALGDSLQS